MYNILLWLLSQIFIEDAESAHAQTHEEIRFCFQGYGGKHNHSRVYLLMQKDDFYVHIIPVLVQEVLQEVGHAFQCYVATDNNVPGTEKSTVKLTRKESQQEWEKHLFSCKEKTHGKNRKGNNTNLLKNVFSSFLEKRRKPPTPQISDRANYSCYMNFDYCKQMAKEFCS